MSFYRSDTIHHYNLILPRDNPQQIMSLLGKEGIIHIEPLNAPLLDRPYMRQAKRCNDCLLRLKQIESILQSKNILIRRKQFTEIQFQGIYQEEEKECANNHLNSINLLEHIDNQIQQIWGNLKSTTKRIEQLKTKKQQLRNNLAIIKGGLKRFGQSFFVDSNRRLDQITNQVQNLSSQVSLKVGVIRSDQKMHLKRTLFRVTKNNCYIVFVPFSDIFPVLNHSEDSKQAYYVLFSGVKGGFLQRKLQRILSTFVSNNYLIPDTLAELARCQKLLEEEIAENQSVIEINQSELKQYLTNISQLLPAKSFCKLEFFKVFILKLKEIYTQLNEMQIYNNFLRSSIFVRQEDTLRLHKFLKQVQAKTSNPSGHLMQAANKHPPTFYVRNLYTGGAQQIVQTYGVPSYKEANPSFFTVITFPFLFGVMFGDIAHGSILMLFGLCLIFLRNHLPEQVAKLLVNYRYMIFLMGFFSTYCGFIYNDFMSISLNIFGSCYNVSQAVPNKVISRINDQCTYPFGLDPVWSISQNNLNYVNSLKMKISVIIAVSHMTLGILIKASNSLYFKKWLDFFFQFLPQLIFMFSLFGYMDFLIIFKWLKNWQPYDSSAPSIITTMINLPLNLGKTQNCCGGQPLWGTPLQTSQNLIQLILILIAFFSIPIMLIPKPLIVINRKKKEKKNGENDIDVEESIEEKSILHQYHKNEEKRQETSSEIFVDQLIQTIQFVLGSISNTASYLRLWALSLAHSQLSEVFFQKTVESGIANGFSGLPIMIFTYPILAGATFGVLLCMDTMQCFLHTLRLHWVEFQNKFYKGNGYQFVSFSFKRRIEEQLKQD